MATVGEWEKKIDVELSAFARSFFLSSAEICWAYGRKSAENIVADVNKTNNYFFPGVSYISIVCDWQTGN